MNDIVQILLWSRLKFGPRIAERYERSIDQALFDVSEDATRPGSHSRDDLRSGLYFYHLKHSRSHVVGSVNRIVRPRHLLVYRLPGGREVHLIRVLHERMKFKDQIYAIEYLD